MELQGKKIVLVGGGVRYEEAVSGAWTPGDGTKKWKSPLLDRPLTNGTWQEFKAGQSLKLDLALGECPGGKLGFILFIINNRTEYEKIMPSFLL